MTVRMVEELDVTQAVLKEYLEKALCDSSEADLRDLKSSESRSFWKVGNGFGVAEIRDDEQGVKGVVVNHLYIRKGRKEILEFDEKVGEWGKSLGASWVGFFTRRNPEAFVKRLGNGWELDSYVLRRDLA